VIRFENVGLRYGLGPEVLRDLSFQIESHSFQFLTGPSGAGKTSVINMIAGLLKPDRGTIALDGDVLFDSEARINVPAWRRRIGTVFQDGRLFPHLSVRRNLTYGRWMNGLADDTAAFTHVVDLLDIGPLPDRRPGKLAGGGRLGGGQRSAPCPDPVVPEARSESSCSLGLR